MNNYNWIYDLISKLPVEEERKKSFIEIAGYPSWETVNSNILGFFFDAEEEHKLSDLFLTSLLDIIDEKKGTIQFDTHKCFSAFSVSREVITKSNKRIDLLIKNENTDWAIIIENKIKASAYNDFEDYWRHVKSINKIGIILSIEEKHSRCHNCFINITHRELIERVLVNLSLYYSKAEDRYLIFLKDYILNMESLYNKNGMNEQLNQFQQFGKQIEELKQIDVKLLGYISDCVVEILKEHDYIPDSKTRNPENKHFSKEQNKKLRLWVDYNWIRYNRSFRAFFELYNTDEMKKYGEQLRTVVEPLLQAPVKIGRESKKDFFHILAIIIPIDSNGTDFKDELRAALETSLFVNLKIVEDKLEQLMKETGSIQPFP